MGALPSVTGYEVRRLDDAFVPELDTFHLRCADFVRLVEGRDPDERDSLALLPDHRIAGAADQRVRIPLISSSSP